MVHTSKIAEIVKKGWTRGGEAFKRGWWVHKTAAREAGLPDRPLFVRRYPWESRGTNAPSFIASFSSELGDNGLNWTGGNTRAEAATALLIAAMAAPAKGAAA